MVSDVNSMSLVRVWQLCNLLCCAYTLLRLVSTCCKICFIRLKVLIGSKGQRLKYSVKGMLTQILYWLKLWCRDRIFDLNCKHSVLTVCCFLNTNTIVILVQVFFRDCCSFTSRKLYVFLEALLCLFASAIWSSAFKGETTISTGWNCAARLPHLKYDWLSSTVAKTATTSNDHGKLPQDTLA